MNIIPLGQEVGVQPQRIVDIPGEAYQGLQTFWQRTRQECEKIFTPAQCQALLGARPTMLQPAAEREGISWYWLVGIGFVLGKVFR